MVLVLGFVGTCHNAIRLGVADITYFTQLYGLHLLHVYGGLTYMKVYGY